MAILTTTDQGLNFTGGSSFIKTGTSTVMSLTTSSDVGIGTTAPSEKLHVDGTGQFGDYLKIGTNVNAGYYQDSSNGAYRAIGTSGNRGYYFQSNGGGSTTMYVGLTGAYASNVGIGTLSPANKIDVNGVGSFVGGTVAGVIDTQSAGIYLSTTGRGLHANFSGYSRNLINHVTGGIIEIGQSTSLINQIKINAGSGGTNGIVTLLTKGAERMRIAADGNVGIGTTSPQASLHVAGYIPITPTGNGVLMGLYTSGSSNYGNIQLNGDTGSFIDFSSSGTDWKGRILYDNSSNHMRFDTGGTERVRINSSGNVGIGTTSPSERLHIKNDDASGNNSRCDIRVENGVGYSEFGTLSGYARIQSNGTEAAAINRAASYFYTDYGLFGAHLTATDTGDGVLGINGGGGTGGEAYLKLMRGNVSGFILNHTSSAIQVRATANIPMFFYTNDTIGIKLNANSTVSFPEYGAGTLVTDASGNITVSSGGGAGGPYLPLAGGTITGNVKFNDSGQLRLGSGNDLRLYHATDSYISNEGSGHLYIQNLSDDRDIIFRSDNGSGGVTEYFRLDGSSTGLTVSAPQGMVFFDSIKAKFGNNDDLQIYHDGTDSIIRDTGTGGIKIDSNYLAIRNAVGNETQAKFLENGAVELYYNGSKKFETTSTGTITTGNVLATNNIYAGGANGFVFGSSTSEGEYIYRSGNDIRVHAGGANRLIVDGDNGNVGVGPLVNSAPLYPLDVIKPSNTNSDTIINLRANWANTSADKKIGSVLFTAYDADVNSGSYYETAKIGARAANEWTSSSNVNADIFFETIDAGNLSNRMVIKHDGNVGIGITSPEAKLHVESKILISQDTGDRPKLAFSENVSNDDEFVIEYNGAGAGTGNYVAFYSDISSWTNIGDGLNFIPANGRVGIGTTTPSAKLEVNGHFAATTKSFIIDNPKTGGKLQYGVVESNEHGVYVRGKTDQDEIELPEEWEWLVDEDSVTVDLTSIGQMQHLFIIEQTNKKVKVGGMATNGQYNYVIYGTRKDVDPLEINI